MDSSTQRSRLIALLRAEELDDCVSPLVEENGLLDIRDLSGLDDPALEGLGIGKLFHRRKLMRLAEEANKGLGSAAVATAGAVVSATPTAADGGDAAAAAAAAATAVPADIAPDKRRFYRQLLAFFTKHAAPTEAESMAERSAKRPSAEYLIWRELFAVYDVPSGERKIPEVGDDETDPNDKKRDVTPQTATHWLTAILVRSFAFVAVCLQVSALAVNVASYGIDCPGSMTLWHFCYSLGACNTEAAGVCMGVNTFLNQTIGCQQSPLLISARTAVASAYGIGQVVLLFHILLCFLDRSDRKRQWPASYVHPKRVLLFGYGTSALLSVAGGALAIAVYDAHLCAGATQTLADLRAAQMGPCGPLSIAAGLLLGVACWRSQSRLYHVPVQEDGEEQEGGGARVVDPSEVLEAPLLGASAPECATVGDGDVNRGSQHMEERV